MLSLQNSSLLTLSFFDTLGFAPTKEELSESLFFFNSERSEEFSQFSDMVIERDEFIALKRGEHLIDLRKKKLIVSERYWKKVNRFKWLFHFIPWVRAVFVCNNLSFGNVTEKSDIDLFVMAKKNRLFLVRTWMTLLFHVFGLRRHGKKIASRFCLSFFASEGDLNFEKLQIAPGEDLYLAFWMKSLRPIYGKEFFETFWNANLHWLTRYYPFLHFERDWKETPKQVQGENFLDRLEDFLAFYQLKRAEKKRKRLPASDGTLLTKTFLKFHDEDRRKEFFEKTLLRFQTLTHYGPRRLVD